MFCFLHVLVSVNLYDVKFSCDFKVFILFLYNTIHPSVEQELPLHIISVGARAKIGDFFWIHFIRFRKSGIYI